MDSISEELVAEERSIDYYDHKIGNYLNAQYYGSLFIGSDSREHEFIFDTGSPWLWISCVPCNLCHTTDLYDTSSSDVFTRISTQRKELFYESGSAEGYVSSDRICMSEEICVEDMLFVEVDKTDLAALHYNGVLGLSPGSTQVATTSSTSATNSFIESLYKDGTID